MPRRVTFSKTSEKVFVTKLSDCPSMKQKIWFTQEEMEFMKSNMRYHLQMIRKLLASKPDENDPQVRKLDILGMEKFLTVQLVEEYKFRRAELSREVLAEASLSFGDEIDVDRLARISARSSRWALERARASALYLQQDLDREREQNEPPARRSSMDATVQLCRPTTSRRASLPTEESSPVLWRMMHRLVGNVKPSVHPVEPMTACA